jgi:hypothetical protein
MALKIGKKNEGRTVLISNIVNMQGDDYHIFMFDNNFDSFTSKKEIAEKLLDWYFPDEHEVNKHNVEDINSEFLGHLMKLPNIKGYFLFSHNSRIGYLGLSKIEWFSNKMKFDFELSFEN